MVDALGKRLLARVTALLRTRPDINRVEFFHAVGRPTPSWRSEFLAGTRTTNDLRLVLKMARFFGVSVAYLLEEPDAKALDPGAATLLATWNELGERDRELLLGVVATFRARTTGSSTEAADVDEPAEARHAARAAAAPPRGKRR